jgi:GTP pyrophosphokinase
MDKPQPAPEPLGPRFRKALGSAADLHGDQARKGGRIPYVAHLLAVTAIVLENGGDEDLAIAALLHDAVEDQGGAPTLAEIRADFGDRVADIVEACSDTDEIPKPPWRKRKEAYLAHLQDSAPDVLLVSLADKLHNARSLLMDYRAVGPDLWERFNAGRDGQLWYYRELVTVFRRKCDLLELVDELERVVAALEEEDALGRSLDVDHLFDGCLLE